MKKVSQRTSKEDTRLLILIIALAIFSGYGWVHVALVEKDLTWAVNRGVQMEGKVIYYEGRGCK